MKVKLFWGEQEMPDRYLFLQQNDLDLFNNLISKSNIKQQNEETRYSSPQKQAMNGNYYQIVLFNIFNFLQYETEFLLNIQSS